MSGLECSGGADVGFQGVGMGRSEYSFSLSLKNILS